MKIAKADRIHLTRGIALDKVATVVGINPKLLFENRLKVGFRPNRIAPRRWGTR